MKLKDCRQGDRVHITAVQGGGAFRKRLMEMGFMRGAELSVVKYAPLRDPMEIIIKGFHVSLRVEEAARVEVEKDGSASVAGRN